MKRFIIAGGILAGIVIALLINSRLKYQRELEEVKKVVEKALDTGDTEDMGKAGKALEKNMEYGFPLIVEAAEGGNATRRCNAIKLLGIVEPFIANDTRDKTIDLLMKSFDGGGDDVRREAIRVITTEYEHKDCAGKLREIIKSQTNGEFDPAAIAAMEGLGNIAQEGDVELIGDFLRHRNDILRMGATRGVRNTATVNALKMLLDILPSEKNLMVRISAVTFAGDLGGVLRGKGADDETIKALADLLKNEKALTLMVQNSEAALYRKQFIELFDFEMPNQEMGEKYALEKFFFFKLLVALYHWNRGEMFTVLRERILDASGSERDVLEEAGSSYVEFLLKNTLDVPYREGRTPSVRLQVKKKNSGWLLDIARLLVPMLNTDSGGFALENLKRITGEDHEKDKSEWRELIERYDSEPDSFTPGGQS